MIKHKFMWLEYLTLFLGVLCIGYFAVIAIGHGLRISVIFIWPVFGLIFIVWNRILSRSRRLEKPVFPRRLPRNLFTVFMGVMILYFVVVEAMVISGITAKGEKDLDYIIVLGASVYGSKPSPALRDRVNTAISYLEENPETKVIVSGGQGTGENISEAECMTRLLLDAGIDESRILIEDKSTTTVENIEYSYKMIAESQANAGIVTNNFHVSRAIVTARGQGDYKVCGIAAPFTGNLLPHYMVREFLAFTVELVRGNLW